MYPLLPITRSSSFSFRLQYPASDIYRNPSHASVRHPGVVRVPAGATCCPRASAWAPVQPPSPHLQPHSHPRPRLWDQHHCRCRRLQPPARQKTPAAAARRGRPSLPAARCHRRHRHLCARRLEDRAPALSHTNARYLQAWEGRHGARLCNAPLRSPREEGLHPGGPAGTPLPPRRGH